MEVANIVEILHDVVRDESLRSDIYSRIIDQLDDFDLEDVDLGIDPLFDEIFTEYVSNNAEEEDEYQEDDDYEDDSDSQDEW